jgi:hypothetical protein
MTMAKNELVASQFLTNTAPAISEQAGTCLAIAFPKSRSANYGAAVNFARNAVHYTDTEIDGNTYHFAGFGTDRAQVTLALSVTKLLLNIKGTMFYAGGKLVMERFRIESVLSCYLTACGSKDYRAHCHTVINDPFGSKSLPGEKFSMSMMDFIRDDSQAPAVQCLFPCRFLAGFTDMGLSGQHPSSQEDQIQAAAVRRGCDWCPSFHPEDFKKL